MLPFPSRTVHLSPSSNGATSLNWQEQEGGKLGEKLWNPHCSESESCSAKSDSLGHQRLYSSRNSLGQNTGVGSQSLFQGYLPNPGTEPRFPTLRADSLPAEPTRRTTHCWKRSKLAKMAWSGSLTPHPLSCPTFCKLWFCNRWAHL